MIEWGLCLFCPGVRWHRWVRTLDGVDVPVDVTLRPGGALIPVIADGGARRVDRRRPVDGDREGFRPHWQSCRRPEVWWRERADLGRGERHR